jgi:hypothetical protein
MFTRIWNYLVGIEHHAVDVIVSDFHSIVDRLRASAQKHMTDAYDAAEQALHLNAIETAARKEAQRAHDIALKIEALVR